MTAPPAKARFPFHAVGTDVGGNEVDFTIPMLFASQRATTDKRAGSDRAPTTTASTVEAMAARSANVPGQKSVFAGRR